MKKNLEKKIKYRAILIYVIIVLGFCSVIYYINFLRIRTGRALENIEYQYNALEITNNLIISVGEAQSSSGLYITNRNKKDLDNYINKLNTVEIIIDTLSKILPSENKKLINIYLSLQDQALNITKLSALFEEDNPFSSIDDYLEEINKIEESEYTVINKTDTIITSIKAKKGFFKRLGDAFSPQKDSSTVIINSSIDTISKSIDSSINDAKNAAKKAKTDYIVRIKEIEKKVIELINLNNIISYRISNLLLEFHNSTLKATIDIIKVSKNNITKSYKTLAIIGCIALISILLFIYMILNDINKGKLARKELEKANQKIKQTMESRHKLLLSVSHDIKTPLNSIIGYLDTMDPFPRINSMKNSSMYILAMLENLLEYSALEQGSLKKNFTIFNMHTLGQEIYDMFFPIARNKNLNLFYSANNIRIKCDRTKIKQLIINLVSNAIKYTKEGDIKLSVNTTNNKLEIIVSDTGVGIPKDKIEHIYKPFVRIEENNHLSEGTGLGMFVVNGIIEILEGTISVKSTLDEGTQFTVQIPIEFSTQEIPSGTKKIKIYDDEPTIIKLLNSYLQQLGHIIVEDNPDIIITDMEMGHISGLDILKESKDIPIIIMTGRGDFSLEKATKLGFSGYIEKPFSLESLKEVIGVGENSFADLLHDEEIIQIFKESTKENIINLKLYLNSNDFNSAQAICHKMFPMFAQFGYPIEELKRMNSNKNNEYNGWQNDVKNIIKKIENVF